ncbi:hypothetical protein PtB15_9B390 [Puccinia triticina]|nr:hypothetical protein PtB15_9B390 [Puccinia triticina]
MPQFSLLMKYLPHCIPTKTLVHPLSNVADPILLQLGKRQQFYITLNSKRTSSSKSIQPTIRSSGASLRLTPTASSARLQYLVKPSYGKRTFARPANKISVIVFSTILCSVVVAAIAMPVYKQHYYLINGESIYTWFTLGLFFVLEFVIKVLANGFIFTFNAYLLNTWNHIDFLVLGTLVSDILASLVYSGLTSRFTRSLKAFRALRMINLTMSTREMLYNVLILGFGNLMDALVLMYD